MENSKIKEGKTYTFTINHLGKILDYEGKIISIKSNKFYVKTDEACNIELNLKDIIKIKEIAEPTQETPTIKKKTFTPKHKLTPSIKPDF